jgi:hypothetical protein
MRTSYKTFLGGRVPFNVETKAKIHGNGAVGKELKINIGKIK